MARSNVPKFGNWDNEQNVPYTVYFDKARQNKGGGKMINPNDPLENPEMFAQLEPSNSPAPPPPRPRARQEEPIGRRAVRPAPAPEQRVTREGVEFRQFGNSSPQNEPNYGGGGQRPARSARGSVGGSEHSFERSPLHKVAGRGGGGSPAWEGRSYDNSHGTPARSRLRPNRGEHSPEKGAAVPPFGAWNENDPQSAENFTQMFNKVREERNNGGGNASSTPNHQPYPQRNLPSDERQPKCCPFW